MDAVGLLFSAALNSSSNNYQFMSFAYDMDCAFDVKSEPKSFDTEHLINTFVVFSYDVYDYSYSLSHETSFQDPLYIITNSNTEVQLRNEVKYGKSKGFFDQLVIIDQSAINIALKFIIIATDPEFTPSQANKHIYSSLFGLCIFA